MRVRSRRTLPAMPRLANAYCCFFPRVLISSARLSGAYMRASLRSQPIRRDEIEVPSALRASSPMRMRRAC